MSTARAAAPPDPPRRRGRPRKPPDQRKPERHPSGPSSKRTASPEQTARVVGLVQIGRAHV